jgi:hypothetical protein
MCTHLYNRQKSFAIHPPFCPYTHFFLRRTVPSISPLHHTPKVRFINTVDEFFFMNTLILSHDLDLVIRFPFNTR